MATAPLYLRLRAQSTSPRRLADPARPPSSAVTAGANTLYLSLAMAAWKSWMSWIIDLAASVDAKHPIGSFTPPQRQLEPAALQTLPRARRDT
jgi:hypothetical protein